MKFVLSSFFFRNFIQTIYLAKTKPKDKKKSCLLYNKITQLFFSVTHYTPEGIHIFFNTPSYTQFLYSQINGNNFLHHSKNQRIKESSSHCSKRESNRELKSIDLMLLTNRPYGTQHDREGEFNHNIMIFFFVFFNIPFRQLLENLQSKKQ